MRFDGRIESRGQEKGNEREMEHLSLELEATTTQRPHRIAPSIRPVPCHRSKDPATQALELLDAALTPRTCFNGSDKLNLKFRLQVGSSEAPFTIDESLVVKCSVTGGCLLFDLLGRQYGHERPGETLEAAVVDFLRTRIRRSEDAVQRLL